METLLVEQTPAEWQSTQPREMNTADLSRLLWRGKRTIGFFVLAGALIATAVAFILPVMFTANAMIIPPQQQPSLLASLDGQFSPLAAMGSRDLGLKNPADLYVGILNSQTIAALVIDKFALQRLYDLRTRVDTQKKLARRTHIEAGKDTLIKISVEDEDPKRAAAMTNAYVDGLYAQNNQLGITEAAQRRLFFEQQLNAEKDALAGAEAALKKSQERTGAFHIPTQVEAAVRSIAELHAEIGAGEASLQTLKAGATAQNPEVIRRETELQELRLQLSRLESTAAKQGGLPGDVFIPTARVPEVDLESARRYRDVQYHETLFGLLAKQYEAARIDEAKNAPVIQVVDRAVPPDKKSGPLRALIICLGAALSGAVACVVVSHRQPGAHAL
jgi:uncharacterized protein involved in exopolysaccharide biosynthesis